MNSNLKFGMLAGMCGVLLSTNVSALTFTSFVTSTEMDSAVGEHDAIGFSYAGNKFVGSTYFNNQLYQADLNGNSVQKFGAPLPISSGSAGEIYVSSSLGLGGFPSRSIYAGSQASGTVWSYPNTATTSTAATQFVSGLSGGVRSIAFDPYGLYGHDMIVATSVGKIYRVNSAGTATLLANLGADSEGLDFTPQAFGPLSAGTLVVLSEGNGRVRAVSPTGTVTDFGLVFNAPEMLAFVPLNFASVADPLAGFYAAKYPTEVVKASASEFAPYAGQAIVTEEYTHDIYSISWNGTQFVKTFLGDLGGQPEDGIFVTSALINPGNPVPEPSSLALLSLGLLILAGRELTRHKFS